MKPKKLSFDDHEDLALLHKDIGLIDRQFDDIQKAKVAAQNRVKDLEKKGVDEARMEVPLATVQILNDLENKLESRLEKLIKLHPLAKWIEEQRGIGYASFGHILGVVGPLTPIEYHVGGIGCCLDDEGQPLRYKDGTLVECVAGSVKTGFPSVSKLWAYLGQHVVDGEYPRLRKGQQANWSPRGKVICHLIGDTIARVGKGGPWRAAYDRKRAEYLARPRLGDSGCPMGQVHRTKTGHVLRCVKTDQDGSETSDHIHNAAKRYAVKELLKAMWVEWMRQAEEAVPPTMSVPA